MENAVIYGVTRFSDYDIYLLKEGNHAKLYEKLGSHLMQAHGRDGVYFAVWAPSADYVSVVGDFNHYDSAAHPLQLRGDGSGVWEGFVPGAGHGDTYKYHIGNGGSVHEKSDPYALFWEQAPNSATRVWDIGGYEWNDAEWMQTRHKHNAHNAPISVYEVHLGSWRRVVEEENRSLTYREAAEALAEYLLKMNYTHVELMPVTEFPFEGSWGYQVTGYFAPTSRFGEPHDFMAFVDVMHQNGIGVIMDWVPSHFVTDGHGLIKFDGTALYEHEDPRQGFHPEWGSAIFNYGRNEVRAFLVSSAMFWLEHYHIDGFRVDAVASMLYLNYAREEGEWIPNEFGGNENLEAITFLRQLNTTVYGEHPDVMMIAEESTAWPMVTRPVHIGGLGFGFKWNMGWMHDTLKYMKYDPIYRQHHHHQLTFSFVYSFSENYMLPLSHDEVVHMKGSMITRMPGLEGQKFSNLRALYGYMTAHPGKKLLFMGGEIAQYAEWNYKASLDWHLLEQPLHRQMQECVAALNALYKNERALHFYDESPEGFEWVDETDYTNNTVSFVRKSDKEEEAIIAVSNFSTQTRERYLMGVPYPGRWKEIFNTEWSEFGGFGVSNPEPLVSEKREVHGREDSIELTLPPMGTIFLKREF